MFSFTAEDLFVLLPTLILGAGACLVMLVDMCLGQGDFKPRVVHALTVLLLAGAMSVSVYHYSDATPKHLEGHLGAAVAAAWNFRMHTVISALFIQVLTFLVLLSSGSWLDAEDRHHHGDYHALLLFFATGAIIFVSARNLILAFLGLEIFSIALYVLVAFRRQRSISIEAGLKYFLLGAFAAAVFLFGAALLYAGKGDLDIPELGAVSRPGLPSPVGFAAIGGGLLFVALFFKASIAPFHMWTPDVYEGAPTPITALMSTGTKAAAFLMLMAVARLIPHEILHLVPILTIATILVGNFGALVQNDIKRLLAYSGIAHAGYLMIGYCVLVGSEQYQAAAVSIRAILFYLATYGITNLAALLVIAYLEKSDPSVVKLEGLRGLSRRNPVAAAVLGLAALSLAGIPPTAGFWGKYQIFAAALFAEMPVLAVIGILFSVVGLFYYLKIIVH
ncbi:MAG: NADH-quinone oxidoreductase subunit N, partial [Planctomycetota bacterium]